MNKEIMDWIDKEIEEWKDEKENHCMGNFDKGLCLGRVRGYEAVKKELEQQPQQGWIPVSDRRPESDRQVLAMCADGLIVTAYCLNFDDEPRRWFSHDDRIGSVVAWQPLPEPYKPKETI